MSQIVSNQAFSMEERGQRIERVVDIYESVDAVKGQETSAVTENNDLPGKLQTQNTGGDIGKGRCHRLMAASLVILLVGVLTLGIMFNTQTTSINQLQTENNNLTLSREQLQISYDNLTTNNKWLQSRYDQLQISSSNLTVKGEQLQMSYDNLTKRYDQLNTKYKNVTLSRDQLQTSYDNLTVEQRQLNSSYNNLAEENKQLQKERDELKNLQSALKNGWSSFNSSIYYISLGEKDLE